MILPLKKGKVKIEVDLSAAFERVLGYRHRFGEVEPGTTVKTLLQHLCLPPNDPEGV